MIVYVTIVGKFYRFTICLTDAITAAIELHKYMIPAHCHMCQTAVGLHAICERPTGRVIRWFQCHAEGDRVRQRELLNRFVQFPPGDRDFPPPFLPPPPRPFRTQSVTSPQPRHRIPPPARALTY